MSRLATMVVCGCALAALAAPAVAAAQPAYVALGDSYASGVGTRTYYNDGTNCQRSPDAYGPLIAAARGYALSFDACSGAKTTDVNSSQLGPLSATTSLVTITIGGNDAGFSTVITDCAAFYFNCQSAINTANAFIQNQLPALLKTTYSDVRARAPAAHVVVLGYPHLFTASGATCNFDTLTSTHEKELNQTADLLDGVIAARAAAHSFTYVDPRSAFASHEICSSSEWLNGLSYPVSESFHPNISGQADFASLVEGALP
ncbi:MAG TPA: SGNH/GDSL hydrolase family protein [Solirubrobacteraceae bacterium]|jgi:lysophospholipase L1-like esterase|nr:SGNH/GDSL hydrolase family protein [Solirubrobacteraceae bacterium]